MKRLRKLLSLYVVVPVLVVAVTGGVNCSNATSPQVAEEIAQEIDEEMAQDGETTVSNPADPAVPVLQSDLAITHFELGDYGPKLLRGSTFSILVQVTNHGHAASGEYTLGIWRQLDLSTLGAGCLCGEDDMLGIKTMMDTYTMGSLAPGETHTIKKEDALLAFVAWYDISAEITPIGWQENNNSHHVESLGVEVREVLEVQ